jgi:hypothetical protein
MPGFLQNTQATSPVTQQTTFTSADTTVAKAILTAPGGPFHLFEIMFSSDDTAAIVVDVFSRTGATNFLLGSVTVPAGSGKNGVLPVAFLKTILPDTLIGMDFPGALSLQASCEATMTAAKTLTVTTFSGVF